MVSAATKAVVDRFLARGEKPADLIRQAATLGSDLTLELGHAGQQTVEEVTEALTVGVNLGMLPETLRALTTAAVELEGLAERLLEESPEKLRALEGELEGLASRAAFVAAYLEYRHAMGCDQGHERSAKQANKVRKGVRKAMGFLRTHDIPF